MSRLSDFGVSCGICGLLIAGIVSFKCSPLSITNHTNTKFAHAQQVSEYTQHIKHDLKNYGKVQYNSKHNRLTFYSYDKIQPSFKHMALNERNGAQSQTNNKHIKITVKNIKYLPIDTTNTYMKHHSYIKIYGYNYHTFYLKGHRLMMNAHFLDNGTRTYLKMHDSRLHTIGHFYFKPASNHLLVINHSRYQNLVTKCTTKELHLIHNNTDNKNISIRFDLR